MESETEQNKKIRTNYKKKKKLKKKQQQQYTPTLSITVCAHHFLFHFLCVHSVVFLLETQCHHFHPSSHCFFFCGAMFYVSHIPFGVAVTSLVYEKHKKKRKLKTKHKKKFTNIM